MDVLYLRLLRAFAWSGLSGEHSTGYRPDDGNEEAVMDWFVEEVAGYDPGGHQDEKSNNHLAKVRSFLVDCILYKSS